MPFSTAALVAGGASAGGSLLSGFMGSSAAKSAADAQARSAQAASVDERNQFNTASAGLQPYQAAGTNALSQLQRVLGIGPGGQGPTNPILQMLGIGTNGQPTGGGIDPSTFQSSPGYQYQFQQGQDAAVNAASRGGGLGGNALKALQANGQGLANQGWQQYLGNVGSGWNTLTSNLGSLVGSGQNAANQVGQWGMNLGTELGANDTGVGNALASGIVGSNKALTGGLTEGIGDLASVFSSHIPGVTSGAGTAAGLASAADQYANPYGATGNNMPIMVGPTGRQIGGV